MTITYIIQHSS